MARIVKLGWGMGKKSLYAVIFLSFCFTHICFGEDEKNAQQEVKDFSFVQYEENGGKKWVLNGKSAEVADNKVNIEYLSALSMGKGTMLKLKALEGSFDKAENTVDLRNNVVVASTDGTKLTTDHLIWDAQSKNVSTESNVNIKRPDMDITATGAVCDVEGNSAELKHDISAILKSSEADNLNPVSEVQARQGGLPNTSAKTTITCDGPLELDYRQSRAFFHGNVRVEDSKGAILADRIDVYFNPQTRRVKSVIARGNVKIINGENVTYSDKAIYLVDQGRVILPNRPKLVIQNNGNTN